MNLVAYLRFLANAALLLVVGAAGTVIAVSGTAPTWIIWSIGAVVILGLAAQIVSVFANPQAAIAARDEQVLLTERKSYVLGYWATMAVFLASFALVLSGRVAGEHAFFAISVPLAVAPAAYWVWAYLRGRAG